MLDRIPFESKNAIFAKLGELAEISAFTGADREKYDTSLAVYRDNMAVLNNSLRRGREEGREERNREIALKMKLKGSDYGFIQEITGLSFEEIESLNADM